MKQMVGEQKKQVVMKEQFQLREGKQNGNNEEESRTYMMDHL